MEENRIFCNDCETWITEHDSCECGTTYREAKEIEYAENELQEGWEGGDAND